MPIDSLYSTVDAQLSDWLLVEGGDITNLPLNLLNRAKEDLWLNTNWDYLVVELQLTLNSNDAVTLPSDFGKIINVYDDTNGDDKPDFYYHRNARAARGYKIIDVFTKTTGHAFTMTFFTAPSSSPFLRYQKTLDDFVGTDTEFTFFPGNLLLRKAQLLHMEEAGIDISLYNTVFSSYRDALSKHKAAHQYVNNEMVQEINDDSGGHIITEDYYLDGGDQTAERVGDNSKDLR